MEGDEDLSNKDKSLIQIDDNQNNNVQNVVNAEYCESVSDSSFWGDLQVAEGSLDPVLLKENTDAVEFEESFEDSRLLGELELGSPSNDFFCIVKTEEEIENRSEIELATSVGEVDKSELVVPEDGDDDKGSAKEKAEELQKLHDDETCLPEELPKVSINVNCVQLTESDDINLAGVELALVRDDYLVGDNDCNAEYNEELQMIQETVKDKSELDDPNFLIDSQHALKNCKNDTEFKEEEVSELEHSPLVSSEALALKEDVVATGEEMLRISEQSVSQLDQEPELVAVDDANKDTASGEEKVQFEVAELDTLKFIEEDVVDTGENMLRISEPSVSQLDHESELVAVDDDNKNTASDEEKAQFEVAELDSTKLFEEAEKEGDDKQPIPASNEIENGDMGAEEQDTGTGEDDEDMSAKEMELPATEDDKDEDMGAEELQITTSDENKDEDVGFKDLETPTAEEDENEDVDMDPEEQEMATAEEDEDLDAGLNLPTEEQDDYEGIAVEEQDTTTADIEMSTETRGSGKRKRGRIPKATPKAPVKKLVGEDVCFICFDGGDLVICDRRGCPKAYHPSCVNRDEAFFRAKGRWNCGWHLCSICEKNAHYMCYTCPYSLCKGCIKSSVILCVRGNKGLCTTCMKTVVMIERNELGMGETPKLDFDDKSSWEYLFKDYWSDLKEKLLLSPDEIYKAKSPWKGSDVVAHSTESPDEHDANDNEDGSGSDIPPGNKASKPRKRKAKKEIKPLTKEDDLVNASDNSENKNASKSKKRKTNKRLQSRTEKESPNTTAVAIGSEGTPSSRTEWASKELLEFVMHMNNGDPSALSQFDVQALLLEYIKINKLRDPRRKSQILCDFRLENLFGKSRVGHFEMLKLLESHFLIKDESSQVDELQGIVGDNGNSLLDIETNTGKDKKRKTRKKGVARSLQSNIDDYAAIDTHNINLVYLRRNVIECLLDDPEYFYDKVVGCFVRIRISGSIQKQEMYRLVKVTGTSKADQPYKVVKRTTDIMLEIQNLNKKEVISMDIISNQEFTEDECKRLRQSIKCGLIRRLTLGDIQEKALALQEVRVNDWLEAEVVRLGHLRDRASDTGRMKELRECVEKLQRLRTPEERQRRLEEFPEVHADPKMDPSYESEDDESGPDDKKQDNYITPRSTGFSRKVHEPISPRPGSSFSNESWSGTRTSSSTRELSRNMSNRGFSNKIEDTSMTGNLMMENTQIQERSRDNPHLNSSRNSHSMVASESFSQAPPESSPVSLSPVVPQSTTTLVNETEKMWLYRDPSGKIQGPFSMGQLRKWNSTGYFPKDLKIWKNTENQDESVLLSNALTGNFQKYPSSLKSDHSGRNERSNLPSPTPNRERMGQASEYNLSTSNSSANTESHHTVHQSHKSTPSLSESLGKILESSNSSHGTFSRLPNVELKTNEYSGVLMQGSENTPQPQAGGQFLPTVSVDQYADNTSGSNGGLQNSIQTRTNYNPSIESQSPVPVQQPGYNQWGNVPVAGFASSVPINQANMQPVVQSNQPWPMTNSNPGWVGPTPGNIANQGWVAPPVNPNQGWVAPPVNPNQGWTAPSQGPAPGAMNSNWVPTAPVNTNQAWVLQPGNTNPNWVAPTGNPFPGWVPPGNANPNWVPPGNTNPGWVTPGQNTNPNWVAPGQTIPGNNPGWVQPNPNPGAPNSGGGSGWNRPPSFGNGGGGFPPRNNLVCVYHLSGHCRKGAACDRTHP